MTRFEPRTSGVRSDRSTDWDTTNPFFGIKKCGHIRQFSIASPRYRDPKKKTESVDRIKSLLGL